MKTQLLYANQKVILKFVYVYAGFWTQISSANYLFTTLISD